MVQDDITNTKIKYPVLNYKCLDNSNMFSKTTS